MSRGQAQIGPVIGGDLAEQAFDHAAGNSKGRRTVRRRVRTKEYATFIALAAPNLVLLLIFAYWPALNNVFLSMTSWNFLSVTKKFVGLRNYTQLLTDPDFGQVMVTTLIFVVVTVGASMCLGLGVALLLNRKALFRDSLRAIVFAPHILPGAAVAMIWLLIFDPRYGITRAVFALFGAESPAWMTDPHWALPGVISVYVWRNLGFCAIIYLSAMQSMPQDLFEAAALDGAPSWRRFFHVTLPLLSPTTFFLLIVQLIGAFQAFDILAVMTGGGPVRATTTLSWFVYEQGFKAFNIGYSAAGSVLMFVILVGVTLFQASTVGRRVHYQ